MDQADRLLEQFRIGEISRRELLRSLVVAGVSLATASDLAAAAAPRTPKAPAAAKSFRTVGLSHFSYTVKDYKVSRDFYTDLLGMKIAIDHGRPNEAILTWSRGNREYLIVRHRSPRAGEAPNPSFKAFIDHLALEIADWDDPAVEAELKSRGYEPRPDGAVNALDPAIRPEDDGSYFVQDPGGLSQQISGVGLSAVHPVYLPNKSPVTQPPNTGFKAKNLSHFSYSVPDYTVVRDWYVDLMGMKVVVDNARSGECVLTWSHGDSEYMTVHNHRERPGQPFDPNAKGFIDHFAFTIEDWDAKKVEAELKRRGLDPRPVIEHVFHVKDPDGFDLHICGPDLNAKQLGLHDHG